MKKHVTKPISSTQDPKSNGKPSRASAIELDLDRKQMVIFKKFFHGNEPASYMLLPEAKGCPVLPRDLWGKLTPTNLSTFAEANLDGAGVFMAINRVESDGPVNDSKVTAINAVWLDADGAMDLDAIEALTPYPHLIVCTSPGKYHVYWLVADLPLSEFKPVQQALAAAYGADPAVCNPGRIMRMPGTYHQKGSPVMAKIVYKNEDAEPLQIEALLNGLGVKVKEHTTRDEVSTDVIANSTELSSALSVIPVANDRETWLKVGMAIHSAMPDADGYSLWEGWSKQSSKFDSKNQRKNWDGFKVGGGITVASIFQMANKHDWKAPAIATASPTTEFQLVDEFAKKVKNHLRYESQAGKWVVFQTPVWVPEEAKVVQAGRQTVQAMLEQAQSDKSEQAKKLIYRYCSMGGVRLLLKEASADPDLNVRGVDFDREPHLLAVQNGVVDLSKGEFRAGQSGELLKCQAPTTYDPDANCPQFMKFLSFITCYRPEFADYLQRALGYTVFGHTNEQVFFIAYGRSGNGKGTLFRLMGHVLGPYVKAVSPNLLSRAYAGNPNASSSAIMALNGPRMIQCGEGEEKHRFDTAFIKQLSGSDPLSGRYNHGDQMEFTPVGKLWLSANDLPEVPQQDEAMWRRIRVLPFNATIEHRDGAYEEKLRAEAPGVLNWLIEGAQKYAENGLGDCAAVTKASSRARKSADSVAAWIKANCKVVDGERVQASVAYDDYRKFCLSQDRQKLSVQRFFAAMNAKGYGSEGTNRCNFHVGIRLTKS